MKILIITNFKLKKENENEPSSLIWYIFNFLLKFHEIDVKHIPINSKLELLGFGKKISINELRYDLYICYPLSIFKRIPNEIKSKSIVIGPDSVTLLYYRFFKTSNSFFLKLKNFLLVVWFSQIEKNIISLSKRFIVVGKNDSRWLKKKFDKENISYLTHPIIDYSHKKVDYINYPGKINFIISGFYNKKNCMKNINVYLKKLDSLYECSFIVVGKKNKWLFKLIFNKFPKKTFYIERVANFKEICNPIKHVHIVPLKAGAGTKNRVLTALNYDCTVLTSFVGYENIFYNYSGNKLLMLKEYELIPELLKTRSKTKFEEKVNLRFKNEFKSLIK